MGSGDDMTFKEELMTFEKEVLAEYIGSARWPGARPTVLLDLSLIDFNKKFKSIEERVDRLTKRRELSKSTAEKVFWSEQIMKLLAEQNELIREYQGGDRNEQVSKNKL